MNIRSGLIALLMIAFLTGCAAKPVAPEKLYTQQEYKQMTYCVGMSDTSRYVASRKLDGKSREEMREFFANKEYTKLNLATVDKVYAESFTSAWDYTISFFKECADNLAKVPVDRINMGSYCLQNSMIADVAHSFMSADAPREKAYTYFSKFKSKAPNLIIDKVYASSKSRQEIKLEVWSACMSVLTESAAP